MNALAASASLVSAATFAVKTTICCNSTGNGPTTSKPGAVSTLTRNTPSSASPLARRSNTRKTWAPAALYGGDGLRLEQRLLQSFGRADVGLGGTRADCDTEADASNVGCRPGRELRLSGGVLEHLPMDNTQVERAASRGQLDQFGGGTEAKNKLMAGGALKLRAELFQRARHAAARQDLEFSSLHVGDQR